MKEGDGWQAALGSFRRVDRRLLGWVFWALTLVILGLSNMGLHFERAWLTKTIYNLPLAASDLKVTDRSARTIQAIRTLDPHQFAWQVYLPAGSAVGVFSTGERIDAGDPIQGFGFTARVGFSEAPDGFLVDARYSGQPVHAHCGNPKIVDLLRGRWDQLVVEQAGRDGVLTADPTVPVTMLRVSLSPALMAEAQARLSRPDQPRSPILFEFAIAPTGEGP